VLLHKLGKARSDKCLARAKRGVDAYIPGNSTCEMQHLVSGFIKRRDNSTAALVEDLARLGQRNGMRCPREQLRAQIFF
jgi:hypothetical protein